jgi:hypothetical protein
MLEKAGRGFIFGCVCWEFWGRDRGKSREIRGFGRESGGVLGLTRKNGFMRKFWLNLKILGSLSQLF